MTKKQNKEAETTDIKEILSLLLSAVAELQNVINTLIGKTEKEFIQLPTYAEVQGFVLIPESPTSPKGETKQDEEAKQEDEQTNE